MNSSNDLVHEIVWFPSTLHCTLSWNRGCNKSIHIIIHNLLRLVDLRWFCDSLGYILTVIWLIVILCVTNSCHLTNTSKWFSSQRMEGWWWFIIHIVSSCRCLWLINALLWFKLSLVLYPKMLKLISYVACCLFECVKVRDLIFLSRQNMAMKINYLNYVILRGPLIKLRISHCWRRRVALIHYWREDSCALVYIEHSHFLLILQQLHIL